MDVIVRPLKIYCDNVATVFFSMNDKYSKSIKHMKLRYLSIKDEVQKKQVSIEHINSCANIADPLTKGLPPKTFQQDAIAMGLEDNQ